MPPPLKTCNRLPLPVGLVLVLLLAFLTGCASPRVWTATGRAFNFPNDTFAFENELVWEYGYDEQSNWVSRAREPKPEYAQRCFVLAESALQFFQGARFDTNRPVLGDAAYRRLIRQVRSTNSRKPVCEDRKIIIPGYANLRSFSQSHEHVLKSELGGRWASYFQRGHWRMVFPFSRRHQERQAEYLLSQLRERKPAVVHLVRFPKLSINHAVLLFAAEERPDEILFHVYDPNQPEAPAELRFSRSTRTFLFPPNDYFKGGRVDVYQVYHHWAY